MLAGPLTYKPTTRLNELVDNYLKRVTAIRIPGMYDLFFSCPMSSAEGEEYGQMRVTINSICDSIAASGFSLYSAMRKVENPQNFDPENIAAENDLAALRQSRNFVMIYPRKALSSCLLEAGYALVNGTPSTYFVRNDDDLPYMLRGAVEAFPNVRRFRFRQQSQIPDLFQRYQKQIIV